MINSHQPHKTDENMKNLKFLFTSTAITNLYFENNDIQFKLTSSYNNFNFPMKQYQFKTGGSANFAKNTALSFDSQPNLKTDSHYGQRQVNIPATQLQKPFKNSTENMERGASGSSNNNINQMRNKLNELLKQTEMMSQKKGPSLVKQTFENQPRAPISASLSYSSGANNKDNESKFLNSSVNGKINDIKPKLQEYKEGDKKFNFYNDSSVVSSSLIGNFSSEKLGLDFNNAVKNSISNQSNYSSKQPKSANLSSTNSFGVPIQNVWEAKKVNNNASEQNTVRVDRQNSKDKIITFSSKSSIQKQESKVKMAVEPNHFYKKESVSSSSSFYGIGIQNSSSKKEQMKPIEIPKNLDECQYKLRVVDQQFRKIKEELIQMTDGKQYYRKQLSQQWRNNKKLKQDYELKISEIKKQHINELEKLQQSKTLMQAELKSIIQAKEKNICSLVNELAEAKVTIVHESYQGKQKLVLDSNQELIDSLAKAELQFTEIKAKVVEKDIIIDQLNQKVESLKDQVNVLSNFKQESINSQFSNFDEILKVQLKSIAEFKEVIERLNAKNNELRQKLVESSRKNEHLANDNRIAELKHRSNLNNFIMQAAIEQSNKDNTISSLNKKIITMEERYKSAMNEIKSKDEFLRQHLVGRTDSVDAKEYVEGVLLKYRQHFPESRQDQLKIDLEKALKKIELYEKYG